MLSLFFYGVLAELKRLRRDDRGYTSETVVAVAALVAAALVVAAILTEKFVSKATGISL